MTKPEYTLLGLFAVGVVAVLIFSFRSTGTPLSLADDVVGVSQSPEEANTAGPAYLVARMPWGLGPPVTMQAPLITSGFAGQAAPAYQVHDNCGCEA